MRPSGSIAGVKAPRAKKLKTCAKNHFKPAQSHYKDVVIGYLVSRHARFGERTTLGEHCAGRGASCSDEVHVCFALSGASRKSDTTLTPKYARGASKKAPS